MSEPSEAGCTRPPSPGAFVRALPVCSRERLQGRPTGLFHGARSPSLWPILACAGKAHRPLFSRPAGAVQSSSPVSDGRRSPCWPPWPGQQRIRPGMDPCRQRTQAVGVSPATVCPVQLGRPASTPPRPVWPPYRSPAPPRWGTCVARASTPRSEPPLLSRGRRRGRNGSRPRPWRQRASRIRHPTVPGRWGEGRRPPRPFSRPHCSPVRPLRWPKICFERHAATPEGWAGPLWRRAKGSRR